MDCDRPFYGKKWGCSGDSLRYHRKHSATGVLLHLSRDGGGVSVGSLSPEGCHEQKDFTRTTETPGQFFMFGAIENTEKGPENKDLEGKAPQKSLVEGFARFCLA